MELLDVLRTTGAIREFEPAPVPDETLYRILDTARFAPNGGNRQAWRVVVVKEPSIRRALRDAYLPGWYEYLAQIGAGLTPWSPLNDRERERRATEGASSIAETAAGGPGGFAEHLDEVPALLVLLADLDKLATVDRDVAAYTMVGGASVYPFAWSILLAARAEGVGGVLTTMVAREAGTVRRLLGVPDTFLVAAMLALGVPERRPTKLKREPVEAFTTVDHYDGTPLVPR